LDTQGAGPVIFRLSSPKDFARSRAWKFLTEKSRLKIKRNRDGLGGGLFCAGPNHSINQGSRVVSTKFQSAFFLALLLVFSSAAVFAHPHVFVAGKATFVFDSQGLSGIRLKWFFDEMFGVRILEDYDADRDGRFNPKEMATLEDEAFSNLKNYNYFTHIKIDGQAFPVQSVRDFSAGVEGGELYYTFFVPCHVGAGSSQRTVVLMVFDPEYYVDFYLAGEVVVGMENADAYNTDFKVEQNPKAAFSLYMAVPTEITLWFSRK